MSSWRDYAHKVEPCANSANSAESPATVPRPAPNGTNGTNGTLPASIREGVASLAKAPAPRVRCPELWPQVTADALRLAAEGWATNALGLGWSPLDLFGAATDPDGSTDADGLAARLRGRRVLAICEGFATVADPGGGRSYLYRGESADSQLLWELGR